MKTIASKRNLHSIPVAQSSVIQTSANQVPAGQNPNQFTDDIDFDASIKCVQHDYSNLIETKLFKLITSDLTNFNLISCISHMSY